MRHLCAVPLYLCTSPKNCHDISPREEGRGGTASGGGGGIAGIVAGGIAGGRVTYPLAPSLRSAAAPLPWKEGAMRRGWRRVGLPDSLQVE